MSSQQASPRASLFLAGGLSGLRSWTAYWVVESALLALLHGLGTPGGEYRQPDPRFALVALGLYALAGAGAGMLLGAVTQRLAPDRAASAIPFIGPASLAVVFLFHIHTSGGWRVQVLMAILLTAMFLASLRGGRLPEKLTPLANMWLVAFALLIYPLAVAEFAGSSRGRWLGAAALLLASLAVYGAGRLWSGRAPARARSGVTFVFLSGCLLAASLGYYAQSRPRPLPGDVPRAAGADASRGRANLILIVLDTVRADHLSLYGYQRDTSPHLQRFARDATVFTRAIAAADMTLASHASIFTGLYASQHGAHWALGNGADGVAMGPEFGLRLPANSRTLATILKGQGYRTFAVAANAPYLQPAFQLDQGFEYYSLPVPRILLDRSCPFCLRTDLARLVERVFPRIQFDPLYVGASEVNSEALRLLDQQKNQGRPFFLFLNYMDAHQPYFPPAPYDLKYPGKDASLTAEAYWSIEFRALSGTRPYTEADRTRDQSQYDGAIAYIDARLGDLFDHLKQIGLYRNSLIIITSDHGQSFGEKGLVGHGSSVYQEQVHVPLLIKYPGAPHAEVRNELVSHVDLLPTILESLGYQNARVLPGRSLRAEQPAQATVFSESFPCDLLVSLNGKFRRTERAAFAGALKLITSTNGEHDLYDLSSDPHEGHNLYAERPGEAGSMEASLQRWTAALQPPRAQPAVLNRRDMEVLKSLGYLQ